MRRNLVAIALALGAVVAPAVADPPKELPDGVKRELKALEGRWRAVKFLHADRETVPGTKDDPFVVMLKGGEIDFGGVAAAEVADLDPAADPKCLDFRVRVGSGALAKGSAYESVYRLDGDTLT
jgi:uncharacterized protein (TIGR03067 family)